MQKAKKMSKQTLIIAVLAVLLVLSLALSVTGAWFTDTDTGSTTKEIQFATVDVTVSDGTAKLYPATGNTEIAGRDMLPGDRIALNGEITNGDSDVSIYVCVAISAIKFEGSLDGTSYTVDLTNALAEYLDGNSIAVDSALAALDTNTDVSYTNKDGDTVTVGNLYLLPATADQSFAYSAEITIKTTLGNSVEVEETDYFLNAGAEGADNSNTIVKVKVSATVDVYAIQADNMTDATAAGNAIAAQFFADDMQAA